MKSNYALPITIVVAGALIAGAIFLVSQGRGRGGGTENPGAISPVGANDHILGNPNAAVKVVEYSDLECPYCKTFQATMHEIMKTYGTSGNVAWVFRHFPLAQIHSKAPQEAVAAECAAQVGGNDGFWKFVDHLYEVTPSSNGLDLTQLPVIASEAGLDRAQFEACIANNDYLANIQKSYSEAVAAGAEGTPFVVLVNAEGGTLVLAGAQPFSSMKAAIDQMLGSTGAISATPTGQ